MNWTTDYPTKPGFYWIRGWGDISPRDQIVEVLQSGNFYQTGDDWPYVPSDARGASWQGPIEPEVEKLLQPAAYYIQGLTCKDCGKSRRSFVSWILDTVDGRPIYGIICRECWIKRLTPEQRKVYMV